MSNSTDLNENQFTSDTKIETIAAINLQDIDPSGEFERQLSAIRKRDRLKMLAAGIAAGVMLVVGLGLYMVESSSDSAFAGYRNAIYQTGTPVGYSTRAAGSTAPASGQYGGAVGGFGANCCGTSGPIAGAGGSSLSGISLPDLEKQGLAKYKEETGATAVTAKATNFGCHIQVDIKDKTGKVVRSYGYQGGPLYLIR